MVMTLHSQLPRLPGQVLSLVGELRSHSCYLAWPKETLTIVGEGEIGRPGMLQSTGLQRVRYKLATEQQSVQNLIIRKDMFSLVIFMVCNNAFPTNTCTPVYQF